MACKIVNVTHGKGRLSFTTRDDQGRPWWRDLDLDGKPLYRIGNLCDTCEAIFSREAEAHMPLAPHELADRLRAGLEDLQEDVIDSVAANLPDGHYAAGLLTITPAYFPSASLMRGSRRHIVRQKTMLTATITIPEVFLPLIDEDQYDPTAIEAYEKALARGRQPTALALSVLDARYPSGKAYEWQLAHFLLDGHHKIMAACRVGQPITLLSFYALDQSFAPQTIIDQVLKLRYKS
jgi:hypothetical protein